MYSVNKNKLKLVLLIIFFEIAGMKMFAQSLDDIKVKIDSIFKSVDGNFAMAFKVLDVGGESIYINEKELFHAASTMKTPVMIEVFIQAENNKLSLDDSLFIKNEFKSIVDSSIFSLDISDDSGEELYNFIGRQRTIRELVVDMITVSSNLATNLLIELVGAKNVTKSMRSIGANDINILRGVEDTKAYNLGLNNVVTAYDLMLVFEKLVNNEFTKNELTLQMLDILSRQKHRTRIPAKLPQNIKVAHKTGSITGVGHDSGIVFLPDGRRYVLVLLSKNVKDEIAATEAQANISKLIFDYLTLK